MKSKYPLHPDFADVPDNEKDNNASPLMLKLGNFLLKRQCRKINADGVTVLQEDVTIPGYQGARIKARVFTPAEAEGPMPCIVYFHGGAFVGTYMPHQLNYCICFAREVKCKVILVDYRLALKHPFPVPAEDCYAGVRWTYENARQLGIDEKRIAVLGDSAGGALAAAVCQMTRDRGTQVPFYQMLIYPVTDSTQSSASVRRFTDTPEFNAKGNVVMWRYYLKNGDCGMAQYAAPLLAGDFSGLPPAYVETAEFDCLHDEGVAYAGKLGAAGVPVELNETRGSYHDFDIKMDRQYSKDALAYRCRVLRRVFYHET